MRIQDLKHSEKAKNYFILSGLLFIGLVFTVRAAITGITYDEAYTYLAYVIPLEEDPSVNTIYSIFYGSVANNHWLNTALIACVCKIFQIQYNEFLIRLPSVLFGWIFLFAIYLGYKKSVLNGISLAIMMFCYYLHEFFGLARGYGGSATLVLISILLISYWKKECQDDRLLVIALGSMVLAVYENSVALIVLFCIGIVMICRLAYEKRLIRLLRQYCLLLILYICACILILKYHFRISGEGMPLFASSHYTFIDLIQEYLSMIIKGKWLIGIASILVIIMLAGCVVLLLYKKKLWDLDIGNAFLLYILCVISMNAIFGRGGLFGRTLLPAIPLIAVGMGEILRTTANVLFCSDKHIFMKRIVRFASAFAIIIMALSYVNRFDITHTRDWYDDYNIRTDFYTNPMFKVNDVHASVVFYSQKKEWDYNNLLEKYNGEETLSYRDEIQR